MLSKSQAKSFFLLGTAVCSAIFVGLTVDTFQRIPKQTNQAELSAAAIRGKHLFEKKNCMGCHTILGEGAYYAPELTKVFERRGDAFIKAMLKDPQAMYPEDRKMTNYHFSDEEIHDLTEFLKWIGTMDLNGFPPKPDIVSALTPTTAPATTQKSPTIFNQMCIACHSLQGKGGNIGPKLDGVGTRLDTNYLTNWLTNPNSVKADSKMPKLPLTEAEITELVAFLSQLKEGN
ncbi:MAG TPA: c-type cytochrome [Pseudobdellovibrionaceae bacterium]|nr:c-type cytochrome [Pseudobdellovibrionaceae bacterium]